jgi:hypothetical protein
VLFVLVGGWILDWYIQPKSSGQKKDLVQALGLITAGVAGAVGIYFTWRGQRITQRDQERNQRNTQGATQTQPRIARGQPKEYTRTTEAIPEPAGHRSTRTDHGALHTGHRPAWEQEPGGQAGRDLLP